MGRQWLSDQYTKHNAFTDTLATDYLCHDFFMCPLHLGVAFVNSCIGEQHRNTSFTLCILCHD